MKKKILILDRGIARKVGHHYTYSKNIADELIRRQFDYEIHGYNRPLDISDLPRFYPTFEDYAYNSVSSHDVNSLINRLANTIYKLCASNSKSVLFIPNCTFIEVLAVAIVAETELGQRNWFKLVLRMGIQQYLTDGSRFGDDALNRLRSLAKLANVTTLVDTADAAILWASQGVFASQLPFPTNRTTTSELPQSTSFNCLEDCHFLYIGQGGRHKGLHHILDALMELKRKGIIIRGTIHHLFYNIEASTIEYLTNVNFINRDLDVDEYNDLIECSTHIFSFYDPDTYKAGSSSNILIETLVNRRIPIVSPFRHAFEFLACDYLEFGTKDWSSDSLQVHIENLLISSLPQESLIRVWNRSCTVAGTGITVDALLKG
jgi:hypothetical protein